MKSSEKFSTLKETLLRLLRLYLENAKLTLSEKLTMLFSAALIVVIALVLGIFALAFFAGAAVEALQLAMMPWLSYLIMGFFFILLIFGVIMLKKSLIVNPIARFISRFVFDITSKKSMHN